MTARWDQVGVVLIMAVAACGPSGANPGGDVAVPARANSARLDPAASLYLDGKAFVPPRAGEDRYACTATGDEVASCRQLRPDAACAPMPPVGYWEGQPRCQGTAPSEQELDDEYQEMREKRVPRCVCSCTPAYARAFSALHERQRACAEVP